MANGRRYAALLRGVNVGGKNKLPMSELRALIEGLGHEEIATYVQSGNVVFRTTRAAPGLAAGIEAAIEDATGLRVKVLLRTHPELVKAAASNPYAERESTPSKLHVVFLSNAPARAAIESLDPDRSPGDRFAVIGSEIYLDVPSGSGRSKLTLDYFEKRLAVVATARNWNTLLKLIELTAD
ncbi:MAG TPA: DUF1697 domain-containing protein [Gaiellaceae bacterium]